MSSTKNTAKKEKLKRMAHFFAGFLILFHGYERFDEGHGSYVFFFIAGVIFLIVAALHHRLAARFPMVDSVFFFTEAMLSFVIAYEYFEAGKKALPFVYVLAGCIQLGAIFMLKRKIRNETGGIQQANH